MKMPTEVQWLLWFASLIICAGIVFLCWLASLLISAGAQSVGL